MIFSQLVLLAFIGHWIYSQYESEKNVLKKDIERQLSDAKMQLVDSMLLIHVINPILNDEKGFKLHFSVDSSKDSHTSVNQEPKKSKAFAFFQTSDSTVPPDFLKGKVETTIEINEQSDSASDLLVKGVKLIYDEVRSSFTHDEYEDQTIIKSGDSILFKKIFSDNLTRNGLDLKSEWISIDSSIERISKKNNFYFESRLFSYPYGVIFKDYKLYILKRISPQIMFAFILVFLTAAAFYLSHKSLRNQLRLSALKNDFISNISHELKTPVSTVKVAIEALQNPGGQDETRKIQEYLGIAALEISRLELLIEKVLDTSTLEGRKDLIQPKKESINLIIDDVLRTFHYRFREKNVKLILDKIDSNVEAFVDKLHFQGVLINLIDNSLKYGSTDPIIEVEMHKVNNAVLLSIADNGPGIPEEYRSKVFEKFFRVPKQDVHNVKGSGLGLSYAALVIRQHGGTLTVENRKSGGCIFTIKIPTS